MLSIETILVPVDFSAHSKAALIRAIDLARDVGARLHLLHCYEVPYPGVAEYQVAIPDTVWERVREVAARRIEELREQAASAGVEVSTDVSSEPAANAIATVAERIGADLIVMGTRGNTGLEHVLLGSVAERTLRSAPCNVLAVKGPKESSPASDAASPIRTILAAVDYSPRSLAALTTAVELSQRIGAKLHIVHAFSLPVVFAGPYEIAVPGAVFDEARRGAREELEKVTREASAEGVAIESHLAEGPAASAIVATAEELGADLIVMGTHGHTGLKHLMLGSVAERTLRLAPCSVLTVKDTTGS
ncbi:MAG: universal stress protein [Myxococcota bacterium]